MEKMKKTTKKAVKNQTIQLLNTTFVELRENLGEKEFLKRVNKVAKILVSGLKNSKKEKEEGIKPTIVKVSSTLVTAPSAGVKKDIRFKKINAPKSIPAKSKIVKKAVPTVKKSAPKKAEVAKKISKNAK